MLYDVTGRKIQFYCNAASLNVQGLTAGVYLVSNGDRVVKRLIIK